MITLRQVDKKSCYELQIGDIYVLFSYKTPVAIYQNGCLFATDKKFSTTTSAHINAWKGMLNVQKLNQADLEAEIVRRLQNAGLSE